MAALVAAAGTARRYAASDAATQGRTIFVPTGAGTDLDPMGVNHRAEPAQLLRVLRDQLAAAVDGDPATTGPVLPPSD